MKLIRLRHRFSVCKLRDFSDIDCNQAYTFLAKTDEECSLVCPEQVVPAQTIARVDGWAAFRIAGELDFSLVGVIAALSGILARHQIPVFVISTYNTDYILIKEADVERAVPALEEAGYTFL